MVDENLFWVYAEKRLDSTLFVSSATVQNVAWIYKIFGDNDENGVLVQLGMRCILDLALEGKYVIWQNGGSERIGVACVFGCWYSKWVLANKVMFMPRELEEVVFLFSFVLRACNLWHLT